MLLREDLSKEYYAILGVVSSYDGWLLIVKGWSVTLSLAGLGLGFQQRHFALFALAALTGAAFWFLDGLMKGYQYRYYVRMREIEYTEAVVWLDGLSPGRFTELALVPLDDLPPGVQVLATLDSGELEGLRIPEQLNTMLDQHAVRIRLGTITEQERRDLLAQDAYATLRPLLEENEDTISAGNFSEPLTRTDALYFTVTVFSTVGFGDITAKTEAARLVVTGQDDRRPGHHRARVKVIAGAVKQGRQRQPAGD